MNIAIQGEIGSFHEAAAKQWFGDTIKIVPADTFRETFSHVANGNADALVVAIENSLYGSINEVYDLVEIAKMPIVGEVKLRVAQQLIGVGGTPLNTITHIYSHPVALAQCADYLDRHFPHAERIEHHDTAESVAYIKRLALPTYAAIASRAAARYHAMTILDEDIEDHHQNYTRFLVMQPDGAIPTGANRSSLVLTTNHEPGALAHVLTCFAERNINLVKLQSRPILGSPWQYKFYLIVETAGDELYATIDRIEAAGNTITILGEYCAAEEA